MGTISVEAAKQALEDCDFVLWSRVNTRVDSRYLANRDEVMGVYSKRETTV